MAVKFMHSSTLAFSADLGGIIREWDIKKMHEVTTLKVYFKICGAQWSIFFNYS